MINRRKMHTVKKKFYKNLYQSLSFLATIMILVLPLLSGYIISLEYESNFSWILLLVSILLVFLFFGVGFYWIFQKVIITKEGIQIVFGKKVIKKCIWVEVQVIEEAVVMRNPALRIKLLNGSEIHLDKRKNIMKAIEFYSKKATEQPYTE